MANINSYEENFRQLTKNSKEMVELAKAMGEAVTGNEESIVFGDGIILPSFINVTNRLKRAENTIATFVKGHGVVETDDGTYRKIKVDTVSRPPKNVTGLVDVSTFTINPNWFFENFQYPRCIVKVDLTEKIDDDSDRVYVNRIIIDTDQDRLSSDAETTILNGKLSYGEMIEYLNNKMIEYKEDRDEIKLPLTYEKYIGSFVVTGTSLEQSQIDGISKLRYYLSTVNYSTINEDGIIVESGNILSNGDLLRFNNTLFKVSDINQKDKSLSLEYAVGYESLGVGDVLEFYNDPFREKVISVGIGINEIDILYVKGVNENYNLLSRDWSSPIAFKTNDLEYENDSTKNFREYYIENVADFGRDMISQVREGRISSINGIQPNAPILIGDDLRVVQINTQLEQTIDKESYLALKKTIAETKTKIEAARVTISDNQNKLLTTYEKDIREITQNTIDSETQRLNSLTTEFSSAVNRLKTILDEANALSYSPKYHIRGFFAIPAPVYQYDSDGIQIGKQCVIGFETMYRYIKEDETGTPLNTFNFRESSGESANYETGIFSDWNLYVSPFLEKKLNVSNGYWEWVEEKQDGTHVSINQIDIPIRIGEKVEIKVRSISEAGYPYNPIKSDWSNSVIISFPENLSSKDFATASIEEAKNDIVAVTIQETLSSAGVYTHLSDSNAQYKHAAENIEYVEIITDSSTGTTTVSTTSVAEKLRALSNEIDRLKGTGENDTPAIDLTIPSSTGGASKTYSIKTRIPSLDKSGKVELDTMIKNSTTEILKNFTKMINRDIDPSTSI